MHGPTFFKKVGLLSYVRKHVLQYVVEHLFCFLYKKGTWIDDISTETYFSIIALKKTSEASQLFNA